MEFSRRRLLGSAIGLLAVQRVPFFANAAEFEIPKQAVKPPLAGSSLHNFRLGLFSPNFDRPIWAPHFQDIVQRHPEYAKQVNEPELTFAAEGITVSEETVFNGVMLIDPNGVVIGSELFRSGSVTIQPGEKLKASYSISGISDAIAGTACGAQAELLKPYMCKYLTDCFGPCMASFPRTEILKPKALRSHWDLPIIRDGNE